MPVPTSNVVATVGAQGTVVNKLRGAGVRTADGAAVLHVPDMPALAPITVFVEAVRDGDVVEEPNPCSTAEDTIPAPTSNVFAPALTIETGVGEVIGDGDATVADAAEILEADLLALPPNLVFAALLLRMGTCFLDTLPVPCVLLRELATLGLVDTLPPDLMGRETTASDFADVLRVFLFLATALAVEVLSDLPGLDPTRFLVEEVCMENDSDEHNPLDKVERLGGALPVTLFLLSLQGR